MQLTAVCCIAGGSATQKTYLITEVYRSSPKHFSQTDHPPNQGQNSDFKTPFFAQSGIACTHSFEPEVSIQVRYTKNRFKPVIFDIHPIAYHLCAYPLHIQECTVSC